MCVHGRTLQAEIQILTSNNYNAKLSLATVYRTALESLL